MAYGDIAFQGRGEDGCPVQVGVEYKKLPDLLQCISDGRFVGHQLPGMLECYNEVWLLLEGIWSEDRQSGVLTVPRGSGKWVQMRHTRLTANGLHGFLFTLQNKLGIKLMQVSSRGAAVDWLYHLHRWWTHKEWEDHRAHQGFDNSRTLSAVAQPGLVRRVAKELPGIGWERSAAVARRFPTVLEMAVADPAAWQEVDGIGEVLATRISNVLQETPRGVGPAPSDHRGTGAAAKAAVRGGR